MTRPSLKQYMEMTPTTAPVAPAAPVPPKPPVNDPHEAIYNDLIQSVDKIVDEFEKRFEYLLQTAVNANAQSQSKQAVSAEPKSNYKPDGKLPWFNHGIRGFVNKLWHGNHSSNPMWRNENYVTLEAHIYIDEQLSSEIDRLLGNRLDEAEFSIAPLIAQFKQQLIAAIKQHVEKAQVLKTVPSAAPEAETETKPEPEVKTEPEAAPEAKLAQPESKAKVASDAWYASEGVSPEEKKEIQKKWFHNDARYPASYQLVRKAFRHKAVEFMTKHGLDPYLASDTKLAFPNHKDGLNVYGSKDKPIPDHAPTLRKGPKSLKPVPATMGGTDEEDDEELDPLEQYDLKKANQLLENATPTVRTTYYRNLLRYRP